MSRRLNNIRKKLTETKVIDKHQDQADKDLQDFMKNDCGLSEKEIKKRGDGTFENLDQFIEDNVSKRHALEETQSS